MQLVVRVLIPNAGAGQYKSTGAVQAAGCLDAAECWRRRIATQRPLDPGTRLALTLSHHEFC